MKKLCFVAGLLAIISAAAYAQEEKPGDEIRKLQVQMKELRDEIGQLSLLNALGLSLEQAQQLKALLDNVRLARDLHSQQMLSGQKESVEVLKQIRDKLAEGAGEPPEELVEKYNELRKATNAANKEFFAKLKEADEEINSLLTKEQKQKIKNPPDALRPDEEGPEAQKARLEQVAKILDRVKTMNEQQLQQSKDKLMQQLIGKLGRNAPRQQVQRARRKIEEIVGKARGMDELDYALWREEFAKQIIELGKPSARGEAARQEGRRRGPELSPVATVLLDEGMLGALEKKIETLKKSQQQKEEEPPEKDVEEAAEE